LIVKDWAELEPVMGLGLKVAMAGATLGGLTIRLTELLA
jgi:hypothetical protein